MKSKLFFLVVVCCMSACTTQADQANSDNIKLYFSHKICENSGKCESLIPVKKEGNYLFKRLESPHDEFYIKDNNGDYYLYYKNVYSEDVQVGWAKAKADNNNQELILGVNKINLALGGIDFVKNGYANKQAESKNYKSGIYYLNENYEGAPYYQKQKIVLKKTANDLVLDCDSYLKNSSVKDDFYGIFYGICSENKKVYFKQLN